MSTGADLIGRALAQAGCKRAFGIPGGEVLALVDGLGKAGISFHLVKHENAGGFMAEGAWHAAGAPGVLVATLGPGMANALNVVANALQDRVPLIFLTGCVDTADAETYTHQIFDHRAVVQPIVKTSFRATRGALGAMLAKACALALDGQPGPVHIDVPINVAEGPTEETLAPWRFASPPTPGAPAPGDVKQAAAVLAEVRRPIVIAGVDAVNAAAGEIIAHFCRRRGAPLITTYKAKGLMDEADPLALGGAGLSPKADAILLPFLAQADAILLIGYDPIEMRINWRAPFPADVPIVEVTPVLRSHGMHQADVTLRGDIAEGLAALDAAAPVGPGWSGAGLAALKQSLADAFLPEPEGWGPAHVFHVLRTILPPETVATADSGAHRILLSQIWRCPAPRTLLQSSALCTMGCAVPLAAGHKLAQPDIPVVAFVGDAGLEMGLGELATLRDLRLPVIVCVLVDASLALIELKQRRSQRPNSGVDFGRTDFAALARALGGLGFSVASEAELRAAVVQARAADRFSVIACEIGRRAYDGKF